MRDRLLKNFWKTACSSFRGKAMNDIYFCKGKYYTEYSDAVSGVPSFEQGRVLNPFERNWNHFEMRTLPGGVTLIVRMP